MQLLNYVVSFLKKKQIVHILLLETSIVNKTFHRLSWKKNRSWTQLDRAGKRIMNSYDVGFWIRLSDLEGGLSLRKKIGGLR